MKTLKYSVAAGLLLAAAGCATTGGSDFHAGSGRNSASGEASPRTDALGRASDQQERACAGISAADRSASPLRRELIVGVEPLQSPVTPQKGRALPPVGATVYVLASPGLTREWLTHVLDCYIVSAKPDPQGVDPFTVGEPTVDVFSTRNGFGVSISGATPAEAREILHRAEALTH